MTKAANQMARNFAGAIARVWRICSELGLKNRKHAMLWIFQVFALSAIMSRSKINMSDFETLLREQTIREWRDLDQTHPHDAHISSRPWHDPGS